MIIDVIAGARPNFMKVAALFAVAGEFPHLTLRLVHTGQHYDANMSDIFLEQLELPAPVHHLEVGSGTQAVQTGEIMKRYEMWVNEQPPDMCMVVGDVNSTVACAMVAAKAGVKVSHVEAGLRSFDRRMPEEINRVLTDSISDLLFATEQSGVANLADEGRPLSAIHLVGHVMIDTLLRMKPRAEALNAHRAFEVETGQYAYLTLHRPSNVDDAGTLTAICQELEWAAERMPIIFPLHPRTRARLETFGLFKRIEAIPSLHIIEPVGYLDSLSLMMNAQLVITDSGGLQEESTVLGVPCLTLRENTERPITLHEGTNRLIGHDWALLRTSVEEILAGDFRPPISPIPYWDGNAGWRILNIISQNR